MKINVFEVLFRNSSLTMDIILANPKLGWKCDQDASSVMNIDDILNHPELN